VLARLLARADRRRWPAAEFETRLLALFGLEPAGEAPIAALSRLGEGVSAPASGWWLRADPVYLQADQARVYLLGNYHLGLRLDEAQALAAELDALVADDGLQFEVYDPLRWYLRLPADPGIRTQSLSAALAGDVGELLPTGPEVRRWHRLLTELQMLLHASAVNAEREARGALPVNGLWLWGGGELPALGPPSWRRLWADSPLARGLARAAGLDCAPVPAGAAAWLTAAPPEPGQLVVLDHGLESSRYRDRDAWQAFVDTLDRDWLAPLEAALRAGRLRRLTLWPAADQSFDLRKAALRRWWRGAPPLDRYR
jgi:hypothetical protein